MKLSIWVKKLAPKTTKHEAKQTGLGFRVKGERRGGGDKIYAAGVMDGGTKGTQGNMKRTLKGDMRTSSLLSSRDYVFCLVLGFAHFSFCFFFIVFVFVVWRCNPKTISPSLSQSHSPSTSRAPIFPSHLIKPTVLQLRRTHRATQEQRQFRCGNLLLLLVIGIVRWT